MNFVNFGIDLGTTNSLIAKFEGGNVQVFKNPLGHKETLPSAVAFRGERILVGDKAKEYVTKDPGNVFAAFKRKMGTNESFLVSSTLAMVTPVQLSAMVLKELKNFVHTGETVESVVITIPASFDTVQSNATKKAGYEAGFREVLLLQEPIAAALAFFNENQKEIPEKGNWLVYDLGGGTFDVALISVSNGELKVVDHEGNNFLGGLDFDTLIIEKIIVPAIVKHTGDDSIEEQMRNRHGNLEKLFYILLYKAEEAKKELSHVEETEIEFTLPDSDEDMVVRISRSQLNEIIHEKITSTVEFIHTILERNSLKPSGIDHIIMVGGSTYIPYVREVVGSQTGIPLAFDADPTTAIVAGSAYYAGSKLSGISSSPKGPGLPVSSGSIEQETHSGRSLKAVYQSVSSEDEELYMAIPEGDFSNLSYRIIREDGGYDSGIKKVEKRISEFLPLQKLTLNRFSIRFFDQVNNQVNIAASPIEIMQGKFNVAGQPLPGDICLEVDDVENNSTKLQVVFERNDILPLKKTIYKEITRTIKMGSTEELVINVLEGSRHSRPHSNLVIGVIEIRGTDLKADLVKGSDVEISLEMSESRDLTVTAFLAMTEQEFKNVFSPSEKYVSVARIKEDITALMREMRSELRDERNRDEESEWNTDLRQCIIEAEKLQLRVSKMKEGDITDEKFEINEARKRISSRYDTLGKEQRVYTLQADYFEVKNFVEEHLPFVDFGREKLVSEYDRLIKDEQQFLRAKSTAILRPKIDAMEQLRSRLIFNTRHFIINYFMYFRNLPMTDYQKPSIAKTLIKQGEDALEAERFEELKSVTINLTHLVSGDDAEIQKIKIKGTGIG
jgi:molecular chaperone DnaK